MNNNLIKYLLAASIILPINSWGTLGHEDENNHNNQELNIGDLSEEEYEEEEEDSREIVNLLLPDFRAVFQNIRSINIRGEDEGPIGSNLNLTDILITTVLPAVICESGTLPRLSNEQLTDPVLVANYIMNPNNWPEIRTLLTHMVIALDIN